MQTQALDIIRNYARRKASAKAKSATPDKASYQEFAAKRLHIQTKDKMLAPLEYNPIQADLMQSLTGRDLVLKARQVGISTAIQGMLYQAAVTSTATTMTLSDSDDNTSKLRRIADRFYRNDPGHPQRGADNDRLNTYPEHDSEVLIATAGAKTPARSSTLSHLHGSEVAFWKDAENILAGATQAGNPKVILESTPNGAQGYFYNLCMEALDGNSDWRLHFYPWWSDPSYAIMDSDSEQLTYSDDEALLIERHQLTDAQIRWRRVKQRELKHLFGQEYPEDARACFLLSGTGYFGDVSGAFSAPMRPVYDPAHRYVAGLDFGQTVDYTTLCIMDSTLRHEVAWLRVNRLEWAEMRRQVAQLCKAWDVGLLNAESNSMGKTNIEELIRELRALGCRTKVVALETTNDSKTSQAGALHETLHRADGLKMQDDPVRRREINAFSATQLPSGAWRLAAAGSEHDDTVIARMLAWAAHSTPKIYSGNW